MTTAPHISTADQPDNLVAKCVPSTQAAIDHGADRRAHGIAGKRRLPCAGSVAQEMMSEWLTAKAACAHAKCSRQTLWRWKQEGLPSGRGGRIRRQDLDAWLADMPEDQANPSPTTDQLKIKQAAARAGVSRQTIWNWSNDGLKVQRRGRVVRIRADVLDQYLQRRNS